MKTIETKASERGWNNYPEALPKVPAGQTAIDVIVMTQDRRPYPMHWSEKDQKFIGGDAVIIAWKYKTA